MANLRHVSLLAVFVLLHFRPNCAGSTAPESLTQPEDAAGTLLRGVNLFMRMFCLSVSPFVRPSVFPFVRPSVRPSISESLDHTTFRDAVLATYQRPQRFNRDDHY